jgi:NAD(P)H-dependent FMN reductase
MSTPKIAIIIGTSRPTRLGHKPAEWIADIVAKRDDMIAEIVDLRDYPMPFFAEIASNAWVPTQNPIGVKWQQKLAEFDGFIFITAEYNHGISAELKNALDYAYPEWNRKAAACVGYSGVGATRAIEQLRSIAGQLQIVIMHENLHIAGNDFLTLMETNDPISDLAHHNELANKVLDDLSWWVRVLKAGREQNA